MLVEREKVIEVIKNYGKAAIESGKKTLDPVDDTIALIEAVEKIPTLSSDDEHYEKMCERFCDGYCKFPYICKTEDELEPKCESCPICEMANEIERLESVINNSLSVLEDDAKKLDAEVNRYYRAGISHAMAVIKEQSVKGEENADTSDKA